MREASASKSVSANINPYMANNTAKKITGEFKIRCKLCEDVTIAITDGKITKIVCASRYSGGATERKETTEYLIYKPIEPKEKRFTSHRKVYLPDRIPPETIKTPVKTLDPKNQGDKDAINFFIKVLYSAADKGSVVEGNNSKVENSLKTSLKNEAAKIREDYFPKKKQA